MKPSTTTLGVLLHRDHDAAVVDLRRRLGLSEPGDQGWRPHVSLLVLLDGPTGAELDEALDGVASRTCPFTVRARGVGVFTGGLPDELVLHVPVVRSPEMAELHADLFTVMTSVGAVIDGHYQPEAWFPHITLSSQPLTTTRLIDRLEGLLAEAPVAWNVPVDRLVRLDDSGIATSFELGTGSGR